MFSSSYKAAVIQMNSKTDLNANLERAYNLINEAAQNDALVVGLPENFAFLGGLSMRMKQADDIAARVPEFLSATAKEFSVYLMGGSYPVPTPEGKVYNHSALYDPQGNECISYDKIHLFDVDLSNEEMYRESNYVESGSLKSALFENNEIGGWGLTVCYDLRFPELYRQLVEEGAQILSVPSAFTYTTGQDHWEVLLRARAIENTAYVFAPAQTGIHGGDRKTWGHAMIVDPWGNVIADAGEEPGVAYGEIDPDKLAKVRSKIPSLQHRRL